MNDRLSAATLKAAFLTESARILPSAAWTVKGEGLVFPEVSPSFGALEAGFDWGEITLYVGRGGDHWHFTPDDELQNRELEESVRQAARDAVAFVARLIADQVVIRWGILVTRTYARRPYGALSRIWRWITPWVREATWSGTAPRRPPAEMAPQDR